MLVHQFMNSNKEISFIEIGCANNAADLIQPLISSNEHRGLFIDANQDILIKRQKSLQEINKDNPFLKHMFLCCIVAATEELVAFYRTDFDYSSCRRSHVLGHIEWDKRNESLPAEMREYTFDKVSEIYMASLTLNGILSAVGNKSLEVLNIDCEGFDCQIITSTDFSVYRPKKICFEHSHSEQVFVGNGSNLQAAINHLHSFGYDIIAKNMNDIVFTPV